MSKRLRCVDGVGVAPVRLNVGGKIFDVSMETISSFQYIQGRLSNNFQSSLDEIGQLYIDRCPELFAVLLQSVRSLTRPRQQYVRERKRDLLSECQFYGVSDWLTQSILGNTASVFFREEDRGITALESSSDMDLLDPFKIDFAVKSSSSLEMTVLLEDQFPRAKFDCPSAEVLFQRLDDLTHGVMRKIGVPGVIAAGGAVTHALAGSCGAFTDVRDL